MKDNANYEFGAFHFCPSEQQLLSNGVEVPLTNKAFETLQVLISKRGHLVEKEEIMSAVWKDSCIEEGNLAVTISMIRKALGDSRRQSKYIQTVVKRGYRFTAPARQY